MSRSSGKCVSRTYSHSETRYELKHIQPPFCIAIQNLKESHGQVTQELHKF